RSIITRRSTLLRISLFPSDDPTPFHPKSGLEPAKCFIRRRRNSAGSAFKEGRQLEEGPCPLYACRGRSCLRRATGLVAGNIVRPRSLQIRLRLLHRGESISRPPRSQQSRV